MQTKGELVDVMKQTGTVTLDLAKMTARYDLRITGDASDITASFKGSSPLRRITKNPDGHWMCSRPDCVKKEALDALLRHLAIEPSNVDTVEFLEFDAQPTPSDDKVSGAEGELSEPLDEAMMRFLQGDKVLGEGMFDYTLGVTVFWPCK